ncbi:MAG: hypothetical protein H7834_00405 [Magnetococcus sp. YQC-9]
MATDIKNVPIILTDIEGYTKLKTKPEIRSVLKRLKVVYSTALKKITGRADPTDIFDLDSVGDGHYIVLKGCNVTDAMRFTLDMEQALMADNSKGEDFPLRLRIGLALGDVEQMDEHSISIEKSEIERLVNNDSTRDILRNRQDRHTVVVATRLLYNEWIRHSDKDHPDVAIPSSWHWNKLQFKCKGDTILEGYIEASPALLESVTKPDSSDIPGDPIVVRITKPGDDFEQFIDFFLKRKSEDNLKEWDPEDHWRYWFEEEDEDMYLFVVFETFKVNGNIQRGDVKGFILAEKYKNFFYVPYYMGVKSEKENNRFRWELFSKLRNEIKPTDDIVVEVDSSDPSDDVVDPNNNEEPIAHSRPNRCTSRLRKFMKYCSNGLNGERTPFLLVVPIYSPGVTLENPPSIYPLCVFLTEETISSSRYIQQRSGQYYIKTSKCTEYINCIIGKSYKEGTNLEGKKLKQYHAKVNKYQEKSQSAIKEASIDQWIRLIKIDTLSHSDLRDIIRTQLIPQPS